MSSRSASSADVQRSRSWFATPSSASPGSCAIRADGLRAHHRVRIEARRRREGRDVRRIPRGARPRIACRRTNGLASDMPRFRATPSSGRSIARIPTARQCSSGSPAYARASSASSSPLSSRASAASAPAASRVSIRSFSASSSSRAHGPHVAHARARLVRLLRVLDLARRDDLGEIRRLVVGEVALLLARRERGRQRAHVAALRRAHRDRAAQAVTVNASTKVKRGRILMSSPEVPFFPAPC